jgi:transaldolase
MQLFLDTAKVDEIKQALDWGIVDGVTTNPTHIAATGRPFLDVIREICELVDGPISAEVVSTDAEGMLTEARKLAAVHANIVVKIPLIVEGIKAIRQLSQESIPTNATLNFSTAQALLAAKVGATYVSPFVGRLDDAGHDGMELVAQTRAIYDNYGFDTRIIVAAVRHPKHVVEGALAGAEIATMRFDIMEALFAHPMTDAGLRMFLEDWKRVPQ